MIMDILNICMQKEAKVWTIMDNYRLGDDIQSRVLAFAFGLSAEIERTLISQRTREALARRKNEGMILGRPQGRKTSPESMKCYPYKDKIIRWRKRGISYAKIGRKLKIHRTTIAKYCKTMPTEIINRIMRNDVCFAHLSASKPQFILTKKEPGKAYR